MKKQKKGFGAALDNRTKVEKAKDYNFAELVSRVNPVAWTVKKKWRTFPIYDQNGSGSCVAQTAAKMLGIMYWLANQTFVMFSATHIYQQRSNKPAAGMIGVNAGDIVRAGGATLEELVPSQKMTDAQMDAIKIPAYKAQVGEIFKVCNYLTVAAKNIDTVASIIQTTGKPVMVWFYFAIDEWTTVPVVKHPTLKLSATDTARHSVTAVDFTILSAAHTADKKLHGKKALIIDDSWGTRFGAAGQRFITEDFYKERNFFNLHFTNFKFEDGEQVENKAKPRYTFTRDLQFSETVTYGNEDVIVLQNILKYEGLFPTNVESTGYFGAVTRKAVMDYQLKNGIKPPAGLVGVITRSHLNAKYGN